VAKNNACSGREKGLAKPSVNKFSKAYAISMCE